MELTDARRRLLGNRAHRLSRHIRQLREELSEQYLADPEGRDDRWQRTVRQLKRARRIREGIRVRVGLDRLSRADDLDGVLRLLQRAA